jgi:soluble P-type ATPase
MLEITILGYKELQLDLHAVTADTFGNTEQELAALTCTLLALPPENQDDGKLAYINTLGIHRTIAIGNGRNDRLMLRESTLGIAVIQEEGAWVETAMATDVVTFGILDALSLIANPHRLIATLRP